MVQQAAQVAELRDSIVKEVFDALGFPNHTALRQFVSPLFRLPVDRFATLASQFDQLVAGSGFPAACRWILPRFVEGTVVDGAGRIPAAGPLLVPCNHPGAYDGLAVVAALPRNDLKIVVSGIPLTRNLPAAARHFIFATADPHGRMGAVRAMIRHLRDGGAILIFPSGKVDPDPAILPGAHAALEAWSPSLELILRKVPQAMVQVAIVSGVLSPASLRNPLIRLQKGWRRLKLAEFIQVFQQLLFANKLALTPRVSFGEPFPATELCDEQSAASELQSLIQRAQSLLNAHTESFASRLVAG